MISTATLLLQLGMVVLVGGLIGAEREYHSKSAGFRTLILICLGSYLFTAFSLYIGKGISPDRIAANVLTGIGFIGAGVIFRGDKKIDGITTAAAIWAVAALGMGIAIGYYVEVLLATALTLATLLLLIRFEKIIDRINMVRTYRIVSLYKEDLLKTYEEKMIACGLRYKIYSQARKDDTIAGTWWVNGSEKAHRRFVELILHDETVKEFEF